MLLGAHESTAGGTHLAFERGAAHRDECLQIFTRNQQQWAARPVSPDEARRFRDASDRCGISLDRVIAHASYLINVASPDPEKLRKSRGLLRAEVRRCDRLGISLLNLHPGAHMGRGEASGLARAIESFNRVIDATHASAVTFVLETTAGSGTTLGGRFEHLRAIIDGVEEPGRFAVCLDTAHSFAAGYDLSTQARYERVMRECDAVLGLDALVAFHLNDSGAPLGSRVDRHEEIGRGRIGAAAFRCLVRDPRHRKALGILELSAEEIPRNLARLRALGKKRPAPRRRASSRQASRR